MNFDNNALGIQDFEKIRENRTFYVDKTDFITEWWKRGSDVTLITRPRRFGKTLNMSMLNCFFSNKFAGRTDLFAGLSVSRDEKMMALQGTFPVIFISFAALKSDTYQGLKILLLYKLEEVYRQYPEVEMPSVFEHVKQKLAMGESADVNTELLSLMLSQLSGKLCDYYGKKAIILLDEYDTPMQEAYTKGYWDEVVSLFRLMFNATFKTNDSLYRAVLTGITRVSRESVFSDFNNPDIVTTTSNKYASSFGFTEKEVFASLDAYNLSDQKETVRAWYDGFRFGDVADIYNPWSIINFLSEKKVGTYWANTSSNELVDMLIKTGDTEVKQIMEDLLRGIPLVTEIDEQIVFYQLDKKRNAIWSLLLASGYLKVEKHRIDAEGLNEYTLLLTNFEVKQMFEKMISQWFDKSGNAYNEFIKALLKGDRKAMNYYMNRVALSTFSSFDSGSHPSGHSEPERFYHGFVLGLLVDLREDYLILSNRESGFGRYDVMLEPLKETLPAIVMEFKVIDPQEEEKLSDTADAALTQIAEKNYDKMLLDKGIASERIFHYGFAFEGKKVLIR